MTKCSKFTLITKIGTKSVSFTKIGMKFTFFRKFCTYFRKSVNFVPFLVKSVISNIFAMVDELTISQVRHAGVKSASSFNAKGLWLNPTPSL